MNRSVAFFLAMTSYVVATPASALEPCLTQSVGAWEGQVLTRGQLERFTSEFHFDAHGQLEGSYHIDEAVPYDGTLTGFHQTDACAAEFTWRDPGGVGIMHIRFEPDKEAFHGLWGLESILPGYIFEGHRPAVS